jgi:hypothetical protein
LEEKVEGDEQDGDGNFLTELETTTFSCKEDVEVWEKNLLRGASNQHDFFVHDSSPMHDHKWSGKRTYLDDLNWDQINELWEDTKVNIPAASTFIEGIGLLKATGQHSHRRRALIHQISECMRLDIWRQSADDDTPQDLLDALPAISFYLRDSLVAGGLIDDGSDKCQ